MGGQQWHSTAIFTAPYVDKGRRFSIFPSMDSAHQSDAYLLVANSADKADIHLVGAKVQLHKSPKKERPWVTKIRIVSEHVAQ